MKMIPTNLNTLTLHVRLTKHCNADCTYCSSYQTTPSRRMTYEEYRKSLEFLLNKILELGLGGKRETLTIQFIGGELLTLSNEYLEKIAQIGREIFTPYFEVVKDGCQSNLIGSYSKVKKLAEIFNGNIGTSYDTYTEQRTVKGDSKKYKQIFMKNISQYKKESGTNIGGIIVLDSAMLPHIEAQISDLAKTNINITIRPVFNGGIAVDKLSSSDVGIGFLKAFETWFLKKNIIIEPFFSLLIKRINKGDISNISGCPFQANCANVSLNLEPNGDIFVCQDMADSSEGCMGNALSNNWNNELFELYKNRPNNLKDECYSCDYFRECQGGCMKESIEQGHGAHGKTDYCDVWKSIFKSIDAGIEKHGVETVRSWANNIYERNERVKGSC